MRIVLIYFALKYNGDWNAIYQALEQKERISIKDLNATEARVASSGWKVLTLLDLEYPVALKTAYKPPFVLWLAGDVSQLKRRTYCVTGNQMPAGGEKWASECIKLLGARGNLIVRDYGQVDHYVATQTLSPQIKVLASGLASIETKRPLPAEALLVTEYPPEVKATRETMRASNRIIAALAENLVLISSTKTNGINQLVSEFLNLGKEIYCFPGGGAPDDGNSELIKQGANLITTATEISAPSTK